MKSGGQRSRNFFVAQNPQALFIVSLVLGIGLIASGAVVVRYLVLVAIIVGGIFEIAYRKNRPRWLRRIYRPVSLGFAIPALFMLVITTLYP